MSPLRWPWKLRETQAEAAAEAAASVRDEPVDEWHVEEESWLVEGDEEGKWEVE